MLFRTSKPRICQLLILKPGPESWVKVMVELVSLSSQKVLDNGAEDCGCYVGVCAGFKTAGHDGDDNVVVWNKDGLRVVETQITALGVNVDETAIRGNVVASKDFPRTPNFGIGTYESKTARVEFHVGTLHAYNIKDVSLDNVLKGHIFNSLKNKTEKSMAYVGVDGVGKGGVDRRSKVDLRKEIVSGTRDCARETRAVGSFALGDFR
ncbi:hypothetical protein HG531_005793 [Fusarium graminearum]|nr:hypothetical protein HG531_005793 [Fusarium graminearum]